MDKHPECPNHPGIYLTCDNTSQGLRWKCTIHGCTVVGWGDLSKCSPADFDTRQVRKHAQQWLTCAWRSRSHKRADVYGAMYDKFGTDNVNLCDRETCQKIIEWVKGL